MNDCTSNDTSAAPSTPRLLRPADCNHAPVGGKAAALAQLHHAGEAVPPFVVLCHEPGAQPQLTPQLASMLEHSATDLAAGGVLAVRSSGGDEDGESDSFAGQFATLLNQRPARVAAAVEAVWQSGFSARIQAYRNERGLAAASAPAVIVQRQISARWAGVAFAADPLDGEREVAMVSAVAGLGEALVSGEASGDTWWVDADGQIMAAQPADDGQPSDLPLALLQQVVAAVRRVSERAGQPQDMEWAIDADERLWLLQARPITQLPPPPTGTPRLWDDSNIAESYGGVAAALTFSFARLAYSAVYRDFCQLLGVSQRRISAADEVFRGLIGRHDGRMYYDLLAWHRLLAMLPGYRVNKSFMQAMMGVRDPLPAHLARLVKPPAISRLRDLGRVIRGLCSLGLNHFLLPLRIRAFYRRLDHCLGQPEDDTANADALLIHYRQLEADLLHRWQAPLVNDFFAMIWFGVLRALCARWCEAAPAGLYNDLIGGDSSVMSLQPARSLAAMAEQLRAQPQLLAHWQTLAPGAAFAEALAHPEIGPPLADYQQTFGDRCLEELKLESPVLQDDPSSFMASLLACAAAPASSQVDHAAASRKQAEGWVDRCLRFRFWRRPVFAWVLRQARRRVRDRENLRFERTRVFGRVRRIMRGIGRDLLQRGQLDQPEDIFHLDLEEVIGAVAGTASCSDLAGLARCRRAECASWQQSRPPSRFLTRGPALVASRRPLAQATAAESNPHQRQGLGCCPGQVRGRARVVRNPRGLTLPPDTILVAERTDPGWIMLFPAVRGLVVERGSLLSHSAIVSRELGLPAVVGVNDATQWLRDGDEVELNGSSGVVRLLARAEAQP